MSNLYLYLAGFIGCAAVIVLSGTKLAKYGDKIAELTGWGNAWVGLILIASVTSLPELMTGIGSVTLVHEPDLAAGNVFGSCVFNLFILSLIDVRIKHPITSLVKTSHLYAGLFGIILIALSGLAIMLDDITQVLFWISPFSILLILVYLAAVWGIFQFTQSEKEDHERANMNKQHNKAELKKAVIAYIANAVLVIGAALFLPYFGEQLAHLSGLSNTFFGTLFLAAATSLPELVVSYAAIRMGAFDLLVGNLLGSNVFNIFILALTDLFYTEGSLFANINADHLESVIVVIIMTAVAGLGFMAKPQRKIWRLSIDTFIILILYIGLMVTLLLKT
jgi:cation:H+ antiporter